MNPAIPATASTSRATAPASVSYPAGTAWAFQIPPSDSRLPTAPNGVSARAANASTPTRSPVTVRGRSSAGTSHGRLNSTSSAATRTADARDLATATGRAARPVTVMAANPPTAAGSIARAVRPGPRPEHAAATTQGSPAYPSSSAHCPISSRSATYGFHT
ncbi:MAG: hypothetical protein K0R62_2503 [Nonomuraea muscovyensis]|nr:hypothetical protein [Nonomuraea muscovyensis]